MTTLPSAPPEPSRAAATRPPTPRLAASWQRSEHYGVPVDVVDAVFTGSLDTDSLLFECGTEVLRGLQSTLANEPVSLMVADRDGLVLSRLCNDRAIVRSLDKVHLAPGFLYSERTAGTNGLGLSLADRTPTLVRAEEHYCTALRGYTCAAAPILDLEGELLGTINLTTWARSSEQLLLALAQSAAGTTSAMMQVRRGGGIPVSAPRGEVFHVWTHRGFGRTEPCRSRAWRAALEQARAAIAAGQVVAVLGEPGAGKSALVSSAHRAVAHRERVLVARVPAAEEVPGWLALWTPELANADTCIVVSGVDTLPAWSAAGLAGAFRASRRADGPQPFVLTATDYDAIPEELVDLVDTVVELPPLRERVQDVMPLARHFARLERRRDVTFTTAATRALEAHAWPGNARALGQVVKAAAKRADVIDAHHLAAEVHSSTGHQLTRLETLERDEIVRCLLTPGTTVARAAGELGMSRATIYRKIAQYGIKLPGRGD